MGKVFRYELRRLLGSKLFWGMLAVTLFYGWQLLHGVTILGVANTAPFSPWSFGSYLAQLLPLLSVALLFFLWNQHNGQAQAVELLTAAAPVKPGRYLAVKSCAVVTAWLLMALAVLGLGLGFLLALFGTEVSVMELLGAAVIALFPPLVFYLGVGTLAGRTQPALLFLLMTAALGLDFLPLPMVCDLYGTTFFAQYPLTLGVLDPALTVPVAVAAGRVLYLSAGLWCFWRVIKKGFVRRYGTLL